jgi:hypothetical protein
VITVTMTLIVVIEKTVMARYSDDDYSGVGNSERGNSNMGGDSGTAMIITLVALTVQKMVE